MINEQITSPEVFSCKLISSEELCEETKPLSLAQMVERFGSSVSLGFLDSSSLTFSIPEVEGVIGYHQSCGCAVVYGDPVCSWKDAPVLASAFHQFCRERGYRVIYSMVSKRFADWAMDDLCNVCIGTTEELFLDPLNYPKAGPSGRTLKKKVNHSIRDGVSVQEYLEKDSSLEKAMEDVTNLWLTGRKGLQLYLARVELFEERIGKRWFYAKRGDEVVGVLLLNRLDAFDGWLLHMVMVAKDAPIGTSEHLIITLLDTLIAENCHYLSFGPSITGELRDMRGLSAQWQWGAEKIFSWMKKIINLEGRRAFWKKFEPESAPSYYLFEGKGIKLRELLALRNSIHLSF